MTTTEQAANPTEADPSTTAAASGDGSEPQTIETETKAEAETETEQQGQEQKENDNHSNGSDSNSGRGGRGEQQQPQAGKQGPLVCHGHSRPIVDLQYSPVTKDGLFLISASKDGKPMLRNGESGDWIGTFEGHKGAVWSACLNQPATLAATGSADFTAKVWDALTGEQVYEFGHKHIVRCVSFSPDSSKLIAGGFEKLLRIYDLTKPEEDPVVLPIQKSSIKCAQWSTTNPNLVYTSLDSKTAGLSVWDLRTNEICQQWETSSTVTSIELSSENVVTTASGNEVAFWKADTGEKVRHHTIPYVVESASLCESRGCFAAGGEDMWVHLYDYESGEEIDCNKGHHGAVHCIRFAPGGETYASGSEDGTIRIWKTMDAKATAAANGGNEDSGATKEEES